MVYLGRLGTLSTLSRRHSSWPFGSIMPYGLDGSGQPTFLISSMAMHTQNLLSDERASLLVAEAASAEDPLGAGRVTLMGRAVKIPESDLASLRKAYLARHPRASYWVDFGDFSFFQLQIVDVYFVGGFGVMGWVSADEYRQAEPDPLAESARGIIEHMNEDHVEAMLLLARGLGGVDGKDVRMTAVDRFGFQLRVETSEGVRGVRIPFESESRSAAEVRRVLVKMVRDLRRE